MRRFVPRSVVYQFYTYRYFLLVQHYILLSFKSYLRVIFVIEYLSILLHYLRIYLYINHSRYLLRFQFNFKHFAIALIYQYLCFENYLIK